MGVLDLLFPKYCVQCRKIGEYICADCFTGISFTAEHPCLVCNKPAIEGITHPGCKKRYTIDGSSASVMYKGIIKKLIYQFKYKPYVRDLQQILSDLLYEGIIQQEQFIHVLQNDSLLVPIPLFPTKEKERGYNQADLLSKNIGKRLGLQTIPVLKRIKKTHMQADLSREERQENMKDAFAIANGQHVPRGKKQIILVDDIITTGATMLEAARLLKKSGVENVWGVALAHG